MRSVIVTGGSRGIGLAIAEDLAAGGFRVVAVARGESPELRAAAESATVSGSIVFRPLDLTHTSAIGAFVRSLRNEFGSIYGLVNNAGIGDSGLLSIMHDETIDRLVRLNTIAPILMTKYVLRSMMLERAGRVINISSIVAATGYSGLSAYAATKASLVGFTRSLAREVGQLGITVNAIAPGFVDTEMTKELTQADREKLMKRSALRRLIDPGDVASVVAFLLSERAKNITGVTLTVDAGNTA